MSEPKRLYKTMRPRRSASELYHQENDKGGKGIGNSIAAPTRSPDTVRAHDIAAAKVGAATLGGALSGGAAAGPLGAAVGYAAGAITGTAVECGATCHLPW